jgi:hypothetical protein
MVCANHPSHAPNARHHGDNRDRNDGRGLSRGRLHLGDRVYPDDQACRLYPGDQACRLYPGDQACRVYPGDQACRVHPVSRVYLACQAHRDRRAYLVDFHRQDGETLPRRIAQAGIGLGSSCFPKIAHPDLWR